MGSICSTSADHQNSRAIDDKVQAEKRKNRLIKKLLLLGPGGAGKSTIFKQLRIIHGGPESFPPSERKLFKDTVYYNVISEMKLLIERSQELLEQNPAKYQGELALQPDSEPNAEFVEYLRSDVNVNEEVAHHIQVLWKDPAIQTAFHEYRARFQVQDNANYFFDNIERIAAESYIPTLEDIRRARARTTGIVEQEFEVKGTTFQLFDVGGQRSERKKWIHCFEAVDGVIFVAALSGYNQTLYEDGHTNRMKEALELFREICNSRWFENTSIILFLNKKDIFEQKIRKVPLAEFFPNYSGPNTYDDAAKFIELMFRNQCRKPNKTIYVHPTCALDQNQIDLVFRDVQHIILTRNLEQSGLLPKRPV